MAFDMSQHMTAGKLIRFTLPTICMMIFASCYTIVDGVFVSNWVGSTALAAVNLIYPVVMILATVGFMVGTGGSAIVSKTRGEGHETRASYYFSMFVWFAFFVGVVLAVLGFIFMDRAAAFLGASGQLLEDATLYGRLCMLSMPFFVLQYAFQTFFVAAGKPKEGFLVIVAAGVANIILDFVFVAWFEWGLPGAAFATIVGELIGGIVPIIYFMRKNSSFLQLKFPRWRWRIIGRACVNGSSEMVTNIAMNVVAMLYNWQLLAYVGEDGVAAYGVIMYTVMIFAAIFMGYCTGTAPLMSYQYGAGNHREMRSLLWKSLGIIAVSGVIMFLLGQWLAEPLSMLFVGYDPELLALTVHGYKIYALCFLIMGFAMYGSSFFTALNNGLVSALISFLRTMVFETGAVILLPLVLGLDGIWLSVTVADIAAVTVTAIFMIALSGRYGYRKPKPLEA